MTATTVGTTRGLPRFGRLQTIGIIYALFGAFITFSVVPNLEKLDKAVTFEPPPDPLTLSFDPRLVTAAIGIVFLLTGISTFLGARFDRVAHYGLITSTALIAPLIVVLALALSNTANTNVLQLMVESLRLGTPIALGAMAGLWCERAGVVNIGIEGMMLGSAGVGFAVYATIGEGTGTTWLWISILAAVLTGGLIALLHAVVSISFRTDQIISGVVINLLALGGTGFLRSEIIVPGGVSSGESTSTIAIPGLSDIPILGSQLFTQKPIFYTMFVVVTLSWFVLFKTPLGLRIRACGEHPHAAETLGVNVIRTRYLAVIVGGLIAGLAGAWFSLETQGGFEDNMTSGAGFIALAALIFGKWKPWTAFAGAMLFGFSRALGTRLQILGVEIGDFSIPSEFWQSLPFVVTIIVVAGAIGRAVAPAADGQPYQRSR